MKTFLALFLVLGSMAFAAESVLADQQLKKPDRASLFLTLRKEHPRLLATGADFAALQQQLGQSAHLQTWMEALRKAGEKTIAQPPSKYEIPDGLRLLATSRRVKERMLLLGLLYRMTGERRYVERAWRELEAAAAFKDWNPRHFLDTAEMTAAFGIAYDWLYDAWTPEQRGALRKAIVELGLKPALAVYHRGNWWAAAKHNWNQVCNGGIGIGALALADEEPELAGELIAEAVQSLPIAMREFGPDGAWGEGPGYWEYATRYNVLFLAACDTALGADFGLSTIPGFSKTGDFPIYFTGPEGETFDYADAHDPNKFNGAWQLWWLATKFNQPAYAAYQMGFADKSPQPMDLVWGARWEGRHPRMAAFPTARYFRGSEVVTALSAWNDPKALFIGFKAGDNKFNHSHLDVGSFVLDANGVRWGTDLGSDDYNLPGYFGKQRFEYYRLRAEGHNTLLINPNANGPAPDQDPKASTHIIGFGTDGKRTFAVADLTPAYARGADEVRRGLILSGSTEVLVQDEVTAKESAEVWWRFHTRAKVELAPDGASAILERNGEKLRVTLLGDPGAGPAKFQLLAAEPLPGSFHPQKQAVNTGVSVLTLHFSGVKRLRFAVRFSAGADAASSIPATARLVPLENWKLK